MQKQISIATAQELLAALSHEQMSIRAATLKAVAADPAKALSVCVAAGVDLFTELSARCAAAQEAGLRAGYVLALLQLDDERVMEFAKDAFLASEDAKMTLLTAEQIARLPEQERIEFLTPVLMAAGCPTKSRAAANLLAGCRNLAPKFFLRVMLLSDHQVRVPPLDEGTLDDWLAELQGPYSLTARKMLKKSQRDGAVTLLAFWKRLPEPIQVWVLQEMARANVADQGRRIRDIIRSTDGEVLLCALRCMLKSSVAEDDEALLKPFYQHQNPAIRGAALQAGALRLNWEALLEKEDSHEVRLAVINRIEKSVDTDAIPLLAQLAEDQNWRVRARVTKVLTAFAPQSLPVLHALVKHERDQVRAVAIQALRVLGQEYFGNEGSRDFPLRSEN